jgi:hypothetical protein
MMVESEVMALAAGPPRYTRSRSRANTRNRMHDVDTTDPVIVESALDRSGGLASC